MMKAVVHINIEIPFEISDHGYLGNTKSSIKEHIEAAEKEVSRKKVFIQGTNDPEPKQVRATMRVQKVELIP